MMHRIRIVNNYLSNIAARALNQAPTVRPRLRGRFDPASPANEPAVDGLKLAPTESIDSERLVENNPAATSENQMAHERLHASRRPSDENGPHTLSFAHRGEKTTSAPLNDTLVPAPQTPVIQVPIATATISTTQPARPVSVNPLAPIASSFERDAPPARTEQRRLPEPRPDDAWPSAEREIKTIIVREERIISEQAREPGSHPTPASALPSSNQPKRSDTTPPPVIVQTRIAPLVEKGVDAFPLSRPSPQPQPIVRVTIGRIEVRAVGSSQSPSKPRATPPVMNLDDYLRRRNQGSTR
jgi:hypothetical protein